MNDFQGRVALVTGASRGIGAATALELAQRGATVVVNYREDRTGAEQVCARIQESGGQARILQGDVGSEGDVRRMMATVAAEVGTVRVLIHNAAPGSRDHFLDVSMEEFDRMYSAIVRGPFLMSQLAARQMIEAGVSGAVVHVSTILAQLAIPTRTLYISAKSAIEGLTRAMAMDLIKHNIRVNTVAPGLIYTEALKANMKVLGEEKFTPFLPGKRFGTAEEVASAIVYLASDAASYITGTLLAVDHGLSVREAGPANE